MLSYVRLVEKTLTFLENRHATETTVTLTSGTVVTDPENVIIVIKRQITDKTVIITMATDRTGAIETMNVHETMIETVIATMSVKENVNEKGNAKESVMRIDVGKTDYD